MSRLRVDPDESARVGFQREVRVRRAALDMTQNELADAVGIAPSFMSTLLSDPDKISVGRLRKIVKTLGPDLRVVLALVGASAKDIQRFCAEK